MWVPRGLLELFSISKETVSSLREELASTRAERDNLKDQLRVSLINSDWLRVQFNTLQLEKTALTEKAYGIKLPAPEIVRTPVIGEGSKVNEALFEDMGEKLAKQFGFPIYDKQ